MNRLTNSLLLAGAAVLLIPAPGFAQRGYEPRGQSEARGQPVARVETVPREDRPALLNKKLASLFFDQARVSVIRHQDYLSPNDDQKAAQAAALAALTKPGVNIYAVESKPYGLDGINAFTFVVAHDDEGPVCIPGDPELETWARKITDSYKAHKVHIDWTTTLAQRYYGMIDCARAGNPKMVLLTVVSSGLSMGDLGSPPRDGLWKTLFSCSAFAVETPITVATIKGSFGLASAVALTSWVSSGHQCWGNLKTLNDGVTLEQRALEDSRKPPPAPPAAPEPHVPWETRRPPVYPWPIYPLPLPPGWNGRYTIIPGDRR